MRRAALGLAALALALTGCETSAEKSAKLERAALRANPGTSAAKGLSIGRAGTAVKVLSATLLRSSEGAAVAVVLRNLSARAEANVPISLTVSDPRGSTLYSNSAAGLAHSLVSVPLIPAHGELTWVDDQVTAMGAGTVTAKLGEGTASAGPVPRISVTAGSPFEEPGSGFAVKGTVVNHSSVAQHELLVYGTARRGGKVIAAGRSVLAELPAGSSVPFQVFFIGDPRGAQIELSVPPATLG